PCRRDQDSSRQTYCSLYNSRKFSGRQYVWEPFIHPTDSCKLSCRARGEHFYANLPDKADNGTPCKLQSVGDAVCINGVSSGASPVGCDGIVESTAAIDLCGVCKGDDSSCQTISGIFTSTHLKPGVNYVISIPRGSTSINITELRTSKNFLILQTVDGRYIINNETGASSATTVEAAGTIFKHEAKDSPRRKESITAPGPTNITIVLKILIKGRNPGIMYSFSVPRDVGLAVIQQIRQRSWPIEIPPETDKDLSVPDSRSPDGNSSQINHASKHSFVDWPLPPFMTRPTRTHYVDKRERGRKYDPNAEPKKMSLTSQNEVSVQNLYDLSSTTRSMSIVRTESAAFSRDEVNFNSGDTGRKASCLPVTINTTSIRTDKVSKVKNILLNERHSLPLENILNITKQLYEQVDDNVSLLHVSKSNNLKGPSLGHGEVSMSDLILNKEHSEKENADRAPSDNEDQNSNYHTTLSNMIQQTVDNILEDHQATFVNNGFTPLENDISEMNVQSESISSNNLEGSNNKGNWSLVGDYYDKNTSASKKFNASKNAFNFNEHGKAYSTHMSGNENQAITHANKLNVSESTSELNIPKHYGVFTFDKYNSSLVNNIDGDVDKKKATKTHSQHVFAADNSRYTVPRYSQSFTFPHRYADHVTGRSRPTVKHHRNHHSHNTHSLDISSRTSLGNVHHNDNQSSQSSNNNFDHEHNQSRQSSDSNFDHEDNQSRQSSNNTFDREDNHVRESSNSSFDREDNQSMQSSNSNFDHEDNQSRQNSDSNFDHEDNQSRHSSNSNFDLERDQSRQISNNNFAYADNLSRESSRQNFDHKDTFSKTSSISNVDQGEKHTRKSSINAVDYVDTISSQPTVLLSSDNDVTTISSTLLYNYRTMQYSVSKTEQGIEKIIKDMRQPSHSPVIEHRKRRLKEQRRLYNEKIKEIQDRIRQKQAERAVSWRRGPIVGDTKVNNDTISLGISLHRNTELSLKTSETDKDTSLMLSLDNSPSLIHSKTNPPNLETADTEYGKHEYFQMPKKASSELSPTQTELVSLQSETRDFVLSEDRYRSTTDIQKDTMLRRQFVQHEHTHFGNRRNLYEDSTVDFNVHARSYDIFTSSRSPRNESIIVNSPLKDSPNTLNEERKQYSSSHAFIGVDELSRHENVIDPPSPRADTLQQISITFPNTPPMTPHSSNELVLERFVGAYQVKDVDISRETSLKTHSLVYEWRVSGLTQCTHSCGGGIQQTVVVCVDTITQAVVTDENCRHFLRPKLLAVPCHTRPCSAEWVAGPWSPCSVSCGTGEQSRIVACQARVSPTLNMTMPGSSCEGQGNIPDLQTCSNGPCSSWQVGAWSNCSTWCGDGHKSRSISCVDANGHILSDHVCTEIKPHSQEPCSLGECGQGWFFTEWSQECSSECGAGVVKRQVFCANKLGTAVPEKRCEITQRPPAFQICRASKLCGALWYTGHWSQCDVTCGPGSRRRRVVCVEELSPSVFAVVEEGNCTDVNKPAETEPCQLSPCASVWYMTSWSRCSKTCGTGSRTREVRCLDPDQNDADDCPLEARPRTRESCNTHSCPDSNKIPDCTDGFNQCTVVKRARLCRYNYYRRMCCKSCAEFM
ncbi:unnamed protein product, partial [Candidula unifasciata]